MYRSGWPLNTAAAAVDVSCSSDGRAPGASVEKALSRSLCSNTKTGAGVEDCNHIGTCAVGARDAVAQRRVQKPHDAIAILLQARQVAGGIGESEEGGIGHGIVLSRAAATEPLSQVDLRSTGQASNPCQYGGFIRPIRAVRRISGWTTGMMTVVLLCRKLALPNDG